MLVLNILHGLHWQKEGYIQRMDVKDWKILLLNSSDRVIFRGRLRQLQAKNIEHGIVEVSKIPI